MSIPTVTHSPINPMNIYTTTGFEGHYPVGTAAVVRADSPEEAADKLNHELVCQGLIGDATAANMFLFENPDEHVRILCDGNY